MQVDEKERRTLTLPVKLIAMSLSAAEKARVNNELR